MTKKLYIKTWGCQMNVYDSDRMADIMGGLGYKKTDSPENADMVILNTCHIREKASEKLFSELGRLKEVKDKRQAIGKKQILAVAGCVAQAEGDVITKRAYYVDLVFGPQTYHQLPEMITRIEAKNGEKRVINTDFPAEEKFDHLPEEAFKRGASAFVSVQEGCDKFCTFCVVPYTRGSEFSRPVSAIIEEAGRIVSMGTRDITLLGQNVNAYHGEGPDGKIWSLARLMEELAKIDGLERIRYTTSHPRDMSADLIAAHHDIPKIMPYLHLPVQSGSNNMLKKMNRKHDRDMYLRIIEDIRAARPDIAISGDFIIGFPGETDQDFEDTMDLVRRVNYSSAYSFKYSPRPGTPGANMAPQIMPHVSGERLITLQALLSEQQKAFNTDKVGTIQPVLFDRRGKEPGQLIGKTVYNQSVYVQGNERLMGQIIDVAITSASKSALTGDIVTVEDKVAA